MGFLEDFIYKPQQQGVMTSALNGVFDILKANVDEVDRNINLSKLLTYKRIQFQRIDITNVAYSLTSLLNNSQVISLMGGSKNTSMQKRLEIWNSMTALEQANILDMVGYYLELTDNVLSTLTDDLRKKKFDIIDFELCDLGNNLLVRNVDYVFYDNKLILLKEFFGDGTHKKKYLIMKNIVIDAGLTESVLGGFTNLPSNKELTKVEYNEILKGFTAAAAQGPIIGEYGKALNRYKSLEGVRVYDKFNANPTRRHFWGDGDGLGDFTKFDFIVSMPVELVYKPEKLEYIINFFNSTKPAYTNFIFSPELLIKDTIPMKAKPTLFKTKSWMSGIKDTLKNKITIAEYITEHWFEEDYLLNQRAKHTAIKTPMLSIYDKWEEIFEKETVTKYNAIQYILDIIPWKMKISGYLETSFIDRVQVAKGLAADAYRLDEDYFDMQVISDPIFSTILTEVADIIDPMNSKLDYLEAIAHINDLIPSKEHNSKYVEMALGDYVKVFNTAKDYVYVSDQDDYFDSLSISDDIHILGITRTVIDVIPDLHDGFGVLNAKNLYDRMNNVDIASKTMSTGCSDNAHLTNKANILKCDSIFICDYLDESCMEFDSAPDGYDEGIEADFVSREAVFLELIPKNI